jgi:hypothetical protein
MPENEARAWWADVQHVRESIERRRGGVADAPAPDAPDDPAPSGRFARAAAEPPIPRLDDLDWPPDLPLPGTRRFERAPRTDGAAVATDDSPARRRVAAPDDRATVAADDSRPRRRHGAAGPDDRAAVTADDAQLRRRAGAATPDADRAASRGRRSRAEADVSRFRSHRADDTRSAAATDRLAVAAPSATPSPAREVRVTTTDTEPAPAPVELDLAGALAPALAPPARRTVQITGRTVAAPALPRLVEVERRRPARRPAERIGPRPDRIALYAVLLGFFLILVAALS